MTGWCNQDSSSFLPLRTAIIRKEFVALIGHGLKAAVLDYFFVANRCSQAYEADILRAARYAFGDVKGLGITLAMHSSVPERPPDKKIQCIEEAVQSFERQKTASSVPVPKIKESDMTIS